jgi:hypothetical protein
LQNFHDSLDFEFSLPKNSGELALVLHMRNSMLNTVLLYDVMLKEQGFAALDWMGHDLNHLGNRAELGLWYRENMGMTVSIWRDGEFRKVGRIGDQGPIAWSERAFVLDAPRGDSLKIRLSFVADNWRIDQVRLAVDTQRGKVRTIPVATAKSLKEHRPSSLGSMSERVGNHALFSLHPRAITWSGCVRSGWQKSIEESSSPIL